MRIHSIQALNFKSLVDCRLELTKFNCLIGLNGSGKSTVLQFIDFLGQQVRGDIKGWLKERNWQKNEISSRLTPNKNIEFVATLKSGSDETNVWMASFNATKDDLCCTRERIDTPEAELDVKGGKFRIYKRSSESKPPHETIPFSYEGSILSQLRDSLLPESIIRFRDYFRSIKSLDLLSPEHLRKRTREAEGTLGLGGQKLSAFLHEMGAEKRRELAASLKRVYPQLEALNVKSLRSGWKQLEISEAFSVKKLVTEARHINDGLLRLIAIVAELQGKDQFVLFDEIENGINPELVEFVLDALVNADKQVLVTTHSPMILNYLDDDVAKSGVTYLYKTPKGDTKAVPFFSIPSLETKLSIMGPGEAFADTDLTALNEELAN